MSARWALAHGILAVLIERAFISERRKTKKLPRDIRAPKHDG